MIGVVATNVEREAVGEFFELFKTPWEFARPGGRYRVVISTTELPKDLESDRFLVYGSSEAAVDREIGITVEQARGVLDAEWRGTTFPLYRSAALFAGSTSPTLMHQGRALDYRVENEERAVWRVGYDLFAEVRHLLTEGQPASRAATPTLDIHIAVLRDLLVRSGVSFVEVPPRPAGHDFVCCLTHDLDFFGIRRHTFDRTLAGFVARGSVGTLADLIRGKRPLPEAFRNWAAVVSLPLVLLRLLPDFWRPVDDYARADGQRPSTYFVVPFRDRPGLAPGGGVEATRAVKYQASDVANDLRTAAARGRELAVHAIDAWRDEQAGRAEMAQIAPLTAQASTGVRMHWLYFDSDSPRRLEAAGYEYDSTCGYNDAVGYRAGTSQVFRLPGTERLLELPLSIMDSALFYPGRLNLSPSEGLSRCRPIIDHASRAGGTVVVNWHDRSLAPERLWGRAYDELLDGLDRAAPWYATAADAVAWFRWRRSIAFDCDPGGTVTVKAGPLRSALPGASVVVRGQPAEARRERSLAGSDVVSVQA